MSHSEKWSQFDKFQLAQFVIPEIPDSFKLANEVNEVELLNWDKRELVKEIYHTLKGKNIKYDLELFNSEKNTQRIRTSKEILENPKTGTCLDLAVLFCGICLAYNLLPLLIVVEGHAFAAVSMRCERREYLDVGKREEEIKLFREEPLSNSQKLQQLIDGKNFLAIECTGFARSQFILPDKMPEGKERDDEGFLSFERAIEAGKEQFGTPGRELRFAVDVAIAHEYWKKKPYNLQGDKIPYSVGEIFHGEKFAGDKVAGNKTTVAGNYVGGDNTNVNISGNNTGLAIGPRASATVKITNQLQNSNNPEAQKLADLLKQLQAEIEKEDSGLIPKNPDKALKHLKTIREFGGDRQNSELRDSAETALDALPTILSKGTGLNQTHIDTLLASIRENLSL
jgi:hypothetical protein